MKLPAGSILVFLLVFLHVDQSTPLGYNRTQRNIKNQPSASLTPEVSMTVSEMIMHNGYPAESHRVQTEDGYLLTVHRIPRGRGQAGGGHRPVVFLQHGILFSSAAWVIAGPETSLSYILADAGYDVWMGNVRGNQYSKAHVSLSTDDAEYWQFTWEQMGRYDLPAEIDYVLGHTGQKRLFYVGHSMGNTMFYVMGSLRPEYNSKIIAQFSLGPMGFVSRLQSPLSALAKFVDQLEWVADELGINEFLPTSHMVDVVGDALCKDEAITQSLCSNILFLVCGYDSQLLNETLIPVIIGHFPAGTSTKTVIHYGQEINSGKFGRYDFGWVENLRNYGQTTPPDYDLSLVTAPIYLHYAENDWLSNVDDVSELYSKLPNALLKFDVNYKKFNHLDFLWATDVKELVYDNIMTLMVKHLNS